MVRVAAFLRTAGDIAYAAKVVRVPLFVGLLGGLCLILPDQTREVYRIIAQPSRAHGVVQLCFAILALLLATLIPWLVGRHLTYLYARHLLQRNGIAGIWSRWLPRLCGAMIPVSIAIGLIKASKDIDIGFRLPPSLVDKNQALLEIRSNAATVASHLRWSAGLCLVLAATFLTVVFLRHRRAKQASPPMWYGGKTGIALLAFVVAASIAVSVAPLAIPEQMGALAILLFFLATLTLIAGSLTAYFDRFRVPAISCIFLLAILFSAFGWNDNHAVLFVSREPATLKAARTALDDWLKTRQDSKHYGDKYPVFFVTAAGGGMYAAYHTATVLARLQDRCPNFAQHVFSISGVSGGSLGAAVFTSLAKQYPASAEHQDCKTGPLTGPLEEKVQTYFHQADLLAPVVAASLFPDFLQRFLPIAFGGLDRARALEKSVANAWPQAAPEAGFDNPFDAPFLAHRDDANPGPALILNATDVDRGYRVAVTPFEIEIQDLTHDNIPAMTKIIELHNDIRSDIPSGPSKFDKDITLGTAVGLSARFPWILPAARIPGSKQALRVVDGGYFENSGAETTLDLLRTIQPSYLGEARKIQVHILAINSVQLVERSSWQGISEILSPFRTMLSTRASRGTLGVYHASLFQDDCMADPRCNSTDHQFLSFPLNLHDFPIPLGWQLSPISERVIGFHSGYADKAHGDPDGDIAHEKPDKRISGFFKTADSSSCAVQNILQGPSSSSRCILP